MSGISAVLLATVLLPESEAAPEARAQQIQEPAPPSATQPSIALDLPLSLDGILLGEIVTQINGETVALRPEDLLALVEPQLDEASIGVVRGVATNGDGFAQLPAFEAAGLTVVYDPASLSLQLQLAESLRGVRQVSLREPSRFDPNAGIAPSNFSLGMTAIARVAHVHQQPLSDAGFEPFRADLFGFVNLGGFDGWSVVWDADIDAGRDRWFRRRNVAVVKDNFEDATRLTIGDLRSRPLSNAQRSVDILGVSYRRAYEDIQPFRTLLPRGQSSFSLEREARVIVEIDGQIAYEQVLPPGTYNLRDFPLTSGSTTAVVFVDDGSGPREVASFSTFIDIDLLSEGLSRFDISVGVLANGFAASPRYSSEPAISASYQKGLSTNLTVGGFFEGSESLAHFGARTVLGTPVGLFSAEGAVSIADDTFAPSFIAQYRNRFETGSLLHNVAVQGLWRSKELQTLAGPVGEELSFDLRWLVQADTVQVSLDASHRETNTDRTRLFATGVTWRLFDFNWNARAQLVQRSGREDEYRATLSVSIPLGRSSRLRARATTNGDARIEYQRFGSFGVGDNQVRSQLNRTDEGLLGFNGQLRHIANRFEVDLGHQTRETLSGTVSRSEANIAMGFGYADGSLHFGRPFDAGFVIVERHENLENRRAVLEERGIGVAAHSDVFGPPFVPLRAGYSNYSYQVDVADLELGYDLGVDRLEVLPPFRAGYRIKVGTDQLATVLMRLALPEGEPAALVTGRVFNLADGSEVSRFFTNRTGRLVVENLAPGTYRLAIDGREDLSAQFMVEDGESGIVRLDVVKMELVR